MDEHSQKPSQSGTVITQHRSLPTLIRIYADNQDKKSMCLFWGAFFGIMILASGLTAALPRAIIYQSNRRTLIGSNIQNCTSPILQNDKLICSSFNSSNPIGGLLLKQITPLHQFSIFQVYFSLKNNSDQVYQFKQNITVNLKSIQKNYLSNDLIEFSKTFDITNFTTQFELTKQNSQKMYRAQNMNILYGYGSSFAIARQLDYANYFLTLSFSNVKQFIGIKEIFLIASLVNPDFTLFTIIIRQVFFVISCIGAILYVWRYLKIPQEEVIIEQKLILILSFLQIGFNDPLYPITILKPNNFSSFLSVFVIINMVVFSLLLWTIFFQRIHYENGMKQSTKANICGWKLFYCGILYILAMTLYLNYAYNHFQHMPVLPTQEILSGKFKVLELITLLMALGAVIYICSLYVRNCLHLEQKLWRNQLFMFFTIFFIIITASMLFAGGFNLFDYASSRVLFLYTQTNLYTFYLQRMYTMTSDERQKIQNGIICQGDRMLNIPQSDQVNLDFFDENQCKDQQKLYNNFNSDKFSEEDIPKPNHEDQENDKIEQIRRKSQEQQDIVYKKQEKRLNENQQDFQKFDLE